MLYFTFQGMHALLGGNYRYALTAIVRACGAQRNVTSLHKVYSVLVLSIER